MLYISSFKERCLKFIGSIGTLMPPFCDTRTHESKQEGNQSSAIIQWK